MSVCPQPVDGISDPDAVANGQYGDCQPVQTPVCNQDPSQSCNVNVQQCCKMEKKKICRNVLTKVPTQVNQVIPGGVKWEKKCTPNTITRYRTEYKPVTEVVNRTKTTCDPVTKDVCFNVTSGDYKIEKEQAFGSVKINLDECKVAKTTKEHCHTFPDAKVDCIETTISRNIKIRKVVCGGKVPRKQCFDVPVATCQKRVGPGTCRMVPKQVCQPSCVQSDYCNTCQNFMQNPGYGSCGTSTCGNFYSSGGMNPFGASPTGSGASQGSSSSYPFADGMALLVDDDKDLISDALTS